MSSESSNKPEPRSQNSYSSPNKKESSLRDSPPGAGRFGSIIPLRPSGIFQYNKKAALLLSAGILLLSVICICIIAFSFIKNSDSDLQIEIYQEGELIQEIRLNSSITPYEFKITGENGGTNTIRVTSQSVGIVEASCPDQICVKQGFITNDLLPITCLPNRLVIQLRPAGNEGDSGSAPDIITH